MRGGHYYSEGDELLMSCYFRRNINPMLVLLLRLCDVCREHLKIHPLQIQKVEGLGIYKKNLI